jgi:hypothetical protein
MLGGGRTEAAESLKATSWKQVGSAIPDVEERSVRKDRLEPRDANFAGLESARVNLEIQYAPVVGGDRSDAPREQALMVLVLALQVMGLEE